MHSVGCTINVAALETDIRLHDAGTVGAFHVLRNFSTGIWDVNAAADVSSVENPVVVLFECEFEALLAHKLLPFVKLLHDLQDSCAVATEYHIRSFA